MFSAYPRIAVAQYAPRLGAPETNVAASLARIADAAAAGADILVLPECCTTGYVFEDRSRLLALAEPIPGPTTERWCGEAARTGIHIVAGIAERAGEALFNTAVVVSPSGIIARYRKIHLWGLERSLYQAGDEPVVASTAWGGLGLLVCYDLWFPELARTLVLGGADLLVVPANWAGNPRQRQAFDAHGLAMGYHMAVATACANERPVAVADRIGSEGTLHFLGNSCIFGATGEVLAGPLGKGEEALLVAEVPLADRGPALAQSHLLSRRPDVYARHQAPEKAT